MEQPKLNVLESARKITGHFNAHPDAWRDAPAVADTKEEVDEVIRLIRAGGDAQAQDSTGATSAKNDALAALAEHTHLACRRASALARKEHNPALLAVVNHSLTDLTRGAEEEVLQRHRNVRDAVQRLVPNERYRINDALVQAIDAGIATFESLRGKRDELVTHRIRTTGDLDDHFARLQQLLERLDDEVEGLLDDKEFIQGYFAARVIIDRPGGRRSDATAGA